VTRRALLPLLGLVVLAVSALPAAGTRAGSGYAGSLLRTAPADVAAPTPDCRSWQYVPAREEAKPGTTAWRPTAHRAPIVGYLDRTLARCGEEVGVHLAGHGAATLSVYRVGWYGGRGARLVWTSGPVAVGQPEPSYAREPRTRMREAQWPTSTRFVVQAPWIPGMYLVVARPTGSAGAPGAGAVMPLVIPEQRQAPPLLAVASTLTWAAYNDAGGVSTYYGAKGMGPRANAASLDRPLTGGGLAHLMAFDLPLARFLGRAHLVAGWTTDDEVDRQPSALTKHAGLVFPGHSEYWTARMYDGVEAARNQGVNIAFLGANPVYWQTRLVASPTGPQRRMLIYRSVQEDPAADSAPSLVTVRWRDAPLARDEAELVGTTYADAGVRAGMQVIDPPYWMVAGTGLVTGTQLIRAAANEVDRLTDARGAQPANLQVVMRGAYATPSGALRDFASTYYTTPTGAAVFAAGTTAWPCGLDDSCPFGPVPETTSRAMRGMTANLLHAFSEPRFGLLHPSVPTAVAPVQALWDQLLPEVRGTGDVHLPGGLDED
jgi:hypothetical protein